MFHKALPTLLLLFLTSLASARQTPAQNPVIWADFPDPAVIRVDDTYYMSTTTMHMNPGVPVLKSTNLVDWELICYAYDILADTPALRLEDGTNAYGRGSWASSLRYHNGLFYLSTFSATTNRTHIYTTKDIEHPQWEEHSFEPSIHDHSLFFDDDGRIYLVYGSGNITLVELEPDLSGIKEGGIHQVIVENAQSVATDKVRLPAEGSHMRKINGKYYLMNICWPSNNGRTQILHRADTITGPYEGRVVLQNRGIAQGGFIDTPDGDWYTMLFEDKGAVGRCPWLLPVSWDEEGWPTVGIDGKAPDTLDIPSDPDFDGKWHSSDEFNWQSPDEMPLAWQWNHNPDPRYWSTTAHPGNLRLTTGRIDPHVFQSRNILTQHTFGPACEGSIKMELGNMKDGDRAGLIALQLKFGYVGVHKDDGATRIVQIQGDDKTVKELASIPTTQKELWFKIDCDFKDRVDLATFFYSLDGETWHPIGEPLQMQYTLPQFMGYRFGLFNFATRQTGGYVDFDSFHIKPL